MPRPKKRSFSIKGHRTSLSLEQPFWEALRLVADDSGTPLATLVTKIDATRGNTGLSTAVRIYLLQHYRKLAHERCQELPDQRDNSTGAQKPDPKS